MHCGSENGLAADGHSLVSQMQSINFQTDPFSARQQSSISPPPSWLAGTVFSWWMAAGFMSTKGLARYFMTFYDSLSEFQYLNVCSSVLHTLFHSEFAEKGSGEIDLPGINYDEFTELLRVVYPCHKPITGEYFGL